MSQRDHLRPDESLWDWLALELRVHREEHDQTLVEVASMLGITKGQVSNCEAGRRKPTPKQAETLDRIWETRGRIARLLRWARGGHDLEWLRTFIEYEARISIIHSYSGQLVSWPLQTPRYARALLVAGRSKDLSTAVQARLARQKKVVDRPDPPEVWVLLSESVIDIPIGGPEVMREQLAYLRELAELQHMVIRIVPRSAGAHEGLDGPFKVLTIPEGQLGFCEANSGGRLILDPSEAHDLRMKFDRIASVALPVGPSRDLILQHMKAMR